MRPASACISIPGARNSHTFLVVCVFRELSRDDVVFIVRKRLFGHATDDRIFFVKMMPKEETEPARTADEIHSTL